MVRFFLFSVLVALAVGLAGCANPGDSVNNTPTLPSDVSSDQARTMLLGAASSMPDKFGLDMTITSAGREVIVMRGAFDNTSHVSFIEIKGEPSAFGDQAAAAGEFIKDGISIYTSESGSLYLANKTAFVFPPSSENSSEGFLPSPDDGPFAAFTNPTAMLGDFAKNNAAVKSVTPTIFRGKAGVEMLVSTTQENQSVDATVTMYTDPPRLAQVKTTLPRDAENPQSPLSSANAIADLFYDNDVTLAIPTTASRAVGLAYKSDAFSSGGDATTWTFVGSAGIALSEVEAQVKDSSAAGEGAAGLTDVATLPTLWSMKLSEGSVTKDGVTITFVDGDSDNKVSKGDTLSYSVGEGAEGSPTVILFDAVTGTYIVPGWGFWAVVLGVFLVAFVRRPTRPSA